jgi:hypothetical protein
MIVPTKRTWSVRTAPKAALFGDAALSEADDAVSSGRSGAAVDRITTPFMRHPPPREPRCLALMFVPAGVIADCHHRGRPAVNVGERESNIIDAFDAAD